MFFKTLFEVLLLKHYKVFEDKEHLPNEIRGTNN